MENQKTYSKTKCSCGCGIDKAATDLIHAIRDRMFELNNLVLKKSKEVLQGRIDTAMRNHIERVTRDLLNSEMPYRPWKEAVLSRWYKFINFKRSPVLNALKKVF